MSPPIVASLSLDVDGGPTNPCKLQSVQLAAQQPTVVEHEPSSEPSVTELQNPVLISSGASANVYKAQLRGADVAVRKPRITSLAALDRFERELRLHQHLVHPHILPVIANSSTPPEYYTVSPWLAGGDLFNALHVRHHRFSFPQALQFSLQLADACRCLHQSDIVHRDIKTANILLDQPMNNAYLADLDLAVSLDRLSHEASRNNGRAMHRGPSNGRLSHMVGTLIYMAPEILQGQPHTFAADVYAFAITINEIASATVPYVDRKLPVPELHTILETRFNDLSLRSAIVKDVLRPVIPFDVPKQFTALVTKAWHPDPLQRPTFAQIYDSLKALSSCATVNMQMLSLPSCDSECPASKQSRLNLSSDPPSVVDDARCSECCPFVQHSSPSRADFLMKQFSLCDIRPPPPACVSRDTLVKPGQEENPLRVHGDVSSTSGQRGADRMEDTSLVIHNFADLPRVHLFAVFDGHGGDKCSQFAAQFMPAAICHAWSQDHATLITSLDAAFRDIDDAFLASPSLLSEQSGSTALVTLLYGTDLYVANAGDCRCVLASSDGSYLDLTRDHVATDPQERARIEAAGGTVDPATGRLQGRIIVSRALGDRQLKRFLTPRPDVNKFQIRPDNDFLVLATDGLWDVVSSQEAVALVRSTARSPDLAAKRLALKAIENGSGDNISVIVVFLSHT